MNLEVEKRASPGGYKLISCKKGNNILDSPFPGTNLTSMREFNYKTLFEGLVRPYSGKGGASLTLNSKCLSEVVGAFLVNMNRVATFASAPAEIAYRVRRDQLLSDCATFNLTGKLEPNLRQFLDKEPDNNFETEFEKIARTHLSSVSKEERLDLALGLGVGYIERLLDGDPNMRETMDATYEAVVLQSWTAFETLATDLWVSGVDNEKTSVVVDRLVVASRRLLKPDDNIRPETVRAIGINAKTHYGSFLRAVKMVSFQTLGDIKRFYAIAFGEKFLDLFDTTDNGYIQVLAAFRNAVAHNSGRADGQFIQQVAPFREFSGYKDKDPIKMDGALVLRLRNVVVELGRLLIETMDKLVTP
jgi:hypothetical protein